MAQTSIYTRDCTNCLEADQADALVVEIAGEKRWCSVDTSVRIRYKSTGIYLTGLPVMCHCRIWNRGENGRVPICVAYSLLLALCVLGCGGSADKGDIQAGDASIGDVVETGDDILAGELKASIIIDKVKGNAPLTVHLDADVKGCAHGDSEYLWTFGAGTYSTKKTPGEFVFHTMGMFTIKFEVVCKSSGDTAGDSVEVHVLDSAELSLSQVHLASATTVAPGDTLLLDFDLFNKGDVIEQFFKIVVVLSKDELYQPEKDVVLKEIGVEGMEGGKYKETKIEYDQEPAPLPPDTPEGSYFLFVVADPDDLVTESDEDNNVEPATDYITVSTEAKFKADLYVTAPDFAEGSVVAPGKSIGYSIELFNEGLAVAKNFEYAVFGSTDTNPSPDDFRLTLEESSIIFNLDIGKSIVISSLLRVPEGMAEGDYHAIARVDLGNVVAEEDEADNHAVSPYTFKVKEEEILGFDLSLDSITVSPHDTYLGGSVKVVAEVSNPGNKPSPPIPMAFYISDEPGLNPNYDTKAGSVVENVLPAGGEATLTHVVPMPDLLKPGDYYFSVVLDVGSVLDELDESNNWQLDEEPIHIFADAFVDVGLSDLVVHPKVVKAGKEIKVAYDMNNTGSTASGAFVNYVVLSQDQNISIGEVQSGKDIVVGKAAIAEVQPSVVVERVEKVPMPLALPHDIGQYYVGVIGDAEGNLSADDNKQNQILVSGQPVVVLDPQGGCLEDELEPNNDWNQAVELDEGITDKLGLCGGEDWYSVYVNTGQSLVIHMDIESPLFIEPRPFDLDLEIMDPQGEIVDRAESTGDQETSAAFAVDEEGAYLVRVFPKSVSNQAQYTLEVDVKDPAEGIDLMPVHVSVSPDAIYPGGLVSVSAEIVNMGTEDTPAISARVALSTDTEWDEEDGVMAIIDIPGVAGASKNDIEETLFLPVETFGGNYYMLLGVDWDNNVDETDETNNVGVSGVVFVDESMVCEDDEYEPNNDQDTATPFPPESGAYPDLTVCPELPDVFSVDLPTGITFSVTINYEHKGDKGYVAVDLLDGSKEAVMDSVPTSTSPVVGLPYVFQAGTYYVRVRVNPAGSKGGPYEYTMTWNVGAPLPGDVCQADVHEPNNHLEGGGSIGCGTNHLTMCKKDRDFFRVSLTKGESLWIGLEHENNKLKAGLYVDPLALPIKSVSGNGSINYVAEEDIIVYLGVEPKSSTALLEVFDYSLTVEGVPGKDLSAGPVTLNPLTVDQGEDIQVAFQIMNDCQDPVPGFGYSVYLSSDQALDDDDILLLSGYEGAELGPDSSIDESFKVMAPLDSDPGEYFIMVSLDPDGLVDESQEDNNLQMAQVIVEEVCVDDPLEPNDAPDQAAFILPGTYGSLDICPYDVDWFGLNAGTGETIELRIEAPVAEGDLDLRLYEASDPVVPVAASSTQNDVEELTWVVVNPGMHLIRVNGFLGAGAGYKMTVEVE